jgi:hypothetical protein
MTQWRNLPWWKRLVLIPLAMFVLPISLVAVLAVLLPVAVLHSVVWTITGFGSNSFVSRSRRKGG